MKACNAFSLLDSWLINACIGSLLHNCCKFPSYLQLEIKLQSIDIAFDIYNGVFKGHLLLLSRWSKMLFITLWWQYYSRVHGNQLVQAWNKLQGVAHYFHACWYTSLFESGLSYHKIYQWSMIIISWVVAWWFCGSLSCNYENTFIADYTNANRRESLLKGNSNIFCSGLFQRHFSHSYCKQ